jgi:hypothetical protein
LRTAPLRALGLVVPIIASKTEPTKNPAFAPGRGYNATINTAVPAACSAGSSRHRTPLFRVVSQFQLCQGLKISAPTISAKIARAATGTIWSKIIIASSGERLVSEPNFILGHKPFNAVYCPIRRRRACCCSGEPGTLKAVRGCMFAALHVVYRPSVTSCAASRMRRANTFSTSSRVPRYQFVCVYVEKLCGIAIKRANDLKPVKVPPLPFTAFARVSKAWRHPPVSAIPPPSRVE